jgi:hypothetical protein
MLFGLNKPNMDDLPYLISLMMTDVGVTPQNDDRFDAVREKCADLLARILRLFVKSFPAEHATPELLRLYKPTDGRLRRRWDTLTNQGNPPNPLAERFAWKLFIEHLTTSLEGSRCFVSEDNFEEIWRDFLEPSGAESWPGFAASNRPKLFPDRPGGSGYKRNLGWTKGKWREGVKSALLRIVRGYDGPSNLRPH